MGKSKEIKAKVAFAEFVKEWFGKEYSVEWMQDGDPYIKSLNVSHTWNLFRDGFNQEGVWHICKKGEEYAKK